MALNSLAIWEDPDSCDSHRNQYLNVSSLDCCYDDNGNLTGGNQYAYQYDVENRLVTMRARSGTQQV